MLTPTVPHDLGKWTQEPASDLWYMEGGQTVCHSWSFQPPEGGTIRLSFNEDRYLNGGASLFWDRPGERVFLFRVGFPARESADLAADLLAAAFMLGYLNEAKEAPSEG